MKFSLIFIIRRSFDYRLIIETRDVEFFFFQLLLSFHQGGRCSSHSVDCLFPLEKWTRVTCRERFDSSVIKVSRAFAKELRSTK